MSFGTFRPPTHRRISWSASSRVGRQGCGWFYRRTVRRCPVAPRYCSSRQPLRPWFWSCAHAAVISVRSAQKTSFQISRRVSPFWRPARWGRELGRHRARAPRLSHTLPWGAHPRSWRASAGIPGAPDAPLVLRWRRVDLTLLLQVLPLDRWWSGSVYSVGLVGPDPSKTGFAPVDLRVVGSGRIEVPAGRFECWKLEFRESPESMLTLWVSKDHGWLVKTEQRGWDWRAESALVSATRPAP